MDWSKAKTILIVAFIITNIFILYVIAGESPIDEPTISDEFIENVEELLNDKDIEVDTEIPQDIPYLKSMIVEFEYADAHRLNRDYFNDNGYIEGDENLQEIIKEEESVLIINNRLIIYENKKEEDIYEDIDEEEAIEIGEQFISRGQFDTEDMELTFIKKEDDTFFLEYTKIYDDVYIERTFTNLQIDSRGVKRFERLWLNTKELGEVEIYIGTAPKSILNLLGMQEAQGKSIIDISLCYYFDPEKHAYLEEPGETRQGKAIPAWRIQFDDGYKIFVDEY